MTAQATHDVVRGFRRAGQTGMAIAYALRCAAEEREVELDDSYAQPLEVCWSEREPVPTRDAARFMKEAVARFALRPRVASPP